MVLQLVDLVILVLVTLVLKILAPTRFCGVMVEMCTRNYK
jgi:hypothetical protein